MVLEAPRRGWSAPRGVEFPDREEGEQAVAQQIVHGNAESGDRRSGRAYCAQERHHSRGGVLITFAEEAALRVLEQGDAFAEEGRVAGEEV